MNQRKSKKLREYAIEFNRSEFGRKKELYPRQIYQEAKKLWNSTPSNVRHKLFA
jgi:hypothetical protein